jgi:hypothetical protein
MQIEQWAIQIIGQIDEGIGIGARGGRQKAYPDFVPTKFAFVRP